MSQLKSAQKQIAKTKESISMDKLLVEHEVGEECGIEEGILYPPRVQTVPECPACEYGQGMLMGKLGSRAWFRCRDCGIEFNVNDEEGS